MGDRTKKNVFYIFDLSLRKEIKLSSDLSTNGKISWIRANFADQMDKFVRLKPKVLRIKSVHIQPC